MDAFVFRIIKSIVLGLVMYFSLRHLGFASGAAVGASTIPLVLGFVGVMTRASYSISASVFILAAMSSLLPIKYENGKNFVVKMFSEASAVHGQTGPTEKNVTGVAGEVSVKASN